MIHLIATVFGCATAYWTACWLQGYLRSSDPIEMSLGWLVTIMSGILVAGASGLILEMKETRH